VATCYLAQGRLFEAREKYEEALHIQPDYDAARMGLKRIAEMERRIHRRVAERKRALLGP
jgi:Tfp pilus assembly protein PilF